jgi:L-asparaginase
VLGVNATFQPGLKRRGPSRLRERLDARVFVLKVFPGLDPALPLAFLGQIRGLVVEAYGAGNVPVDPAGRSLRPLLREARARGVPVVMVSQAPRNAVDLSLYEGGAAALAEGAISGGDMTSVAALTKLMHVLGSVRGAAAIRRAMERSVAGERT